MQRATGLARECPPPPSSPERLAPRSPPPGPAPPASCPCARRWYARSLRVVWWRGAQSASLEARSRRERGVPREVQRRWWRVGARVPYPQGLLSAVPMTGSMQGSGLLPVIDSSYKILLISGTHGFPATQARFSPDSGAGGGDGRSVESLCIWCCWWRSRSRPSELDQVGVAPAVLSRDGVGRASGKHLSGLPRHGSAVRDVVAERIGRGGPRLGR